MAVDERVEAVTDKQTRESWRLADRLAKLEGTIDLYHLRFVIEDGFGRKYRLERSYMSGGNTNDPTIVLKIRQEGIHPDA